ncbi:gametogenetin-binding protein 1-like [Elephas maximus indicus]|nr:gametogenetin-binding protein 1-like [Elephas maximus indicus]
MEAPAPTHRPRILGHSSMFRFFRNLMRSKSSPKRSNKGLARGGTCPSQEQDAVHMMDRQGQEESKIEPPSMLPDALMVATPKGSLHLLLHDPSCLGVGDMWPQTLTPMEILQVLAQGKEVKSVLPRGSQEVLGSLSEKEEEEEKNEAARQASGDTGASGRIAQALEVEQECLQRAKTFTREEEKEYLLDGDLKLASSKAGMTPWNHLLSLYKQLQKSAMAKFPLKVGLPPEKDKGEEEEVEEEDSLFNLCVPGIVTLQSPLHKTFRSTDTVGFVESELKKLLAVQRESRLWKMGSKEGRELLAQPEITLEEAGVVDGQHLLLEEMDEMGNWPPE